MTGLTLRTLLQQATASLETISDSPRLDAELMLGHVLARPRSYWHAHPEEEIDDLGLGRFRTLIARRRAGEPIAYITGIKEFWSLPLQVTPDVLIPRPETELLVALALESLPTELALDVLELGTGSGAIALAIASERPICRMTASDNSASALAVARRNADQLQIGNIEFYLGDWFTPIDSQRFHFIVSNPPYIAAPDPRLENDVRRHEPSAALISEHNGMLALARIIAEAGEHLNAGGTLILEHGHDQGLTVRTLLENHGFVDVRTHRDLASLERGTSGILN